MRVFVLLIFAFFYYVDYHIDLGNLYSQSLFHARPSVKLKCFCHLYKSIMPFIKFVDLVFIITVGVAAICFLFDLFLGVSLNNIVFNFSQNSRILLHNYKTKSYILVYMHILYLSLLLILDDSLTSFLVEVIPILPLYVNKSFLHVSPTVLRISKRICISFVLCRFAVFIQPSTDNIISLCSLFEYISVFVVLNFQYGFHLLKYYYQMMLK